MLHRRNERSTTFIDDVLIGMGITEKQVSCASGRTGIVNNLDEETAIRLATLLSDLLHPLVSNEHKRLISEQMLHRGS